MSINIARLRVGDQVHYQPAYYTDQWENGIVKEIRADNNEAVFVVYNCDGDWENYMEYTSALTHLTDLKLGWCHTIYEEPIT